MSYKTITCSLAIVLYASLCWGISGCRGAEVPRQWGIEIEDNCNNEFSTQLLEGVKKQLDKTIYVLTKDNKVIPQKETLLKKIQIDRNWPPHQFTVEMDRQFRSGDGKIYMVFNPPVENGLYTVDIRLFLYQHDGTWQQILNPGNFSFHNELTTTELQIRISNLLVTLTFK